MKWFKTKKIKDKENLSPEQIEYIKKPSLTVFGPSNMVLRRHWDFLIVFIAIPTLMFIAFPFLLIFISSIGAFFSVLIFITVYFFFIYFMVFNSRRLSWNRNNWKSFELFKSSEEKWRPWGIIMFIFFVLILISASVFLKELAEIEVWKAFEGWGPGLQI